MRGRAPSRLSVARRRQSKGFGFSRRFGDLLEHVLCSHMFIWAGSPLPAGSELGRSLCAHRKLLSMFRSIQQVDDRMLPNSALGFAPRAFELGDDSTTRCLLRRRRHGMVRERAWLSTGVVVSPRAPQSSFERILLKDSCDSSVEVFGNLHDCIGQ